MKNGVIALLLSAVLSLTVLAQQTTSTSTMQPAMSQGDTATGKGPLKNESHDFWDGDEPGLAWLVLHPFASKSYVRRHVQSVQGRVDELNELSAANSKMIQDVDSRSQQGIQLASSKANMADEHAIDATNKAQMASQTAASVHSHLTSTETVIGNIDQYNASTQTEIRFRRGQTALSKSAKEALDQVASQLKDQHGYIIEVQGFSAGQGQAAIANSRNMAAAVERYLVLNQEIPAYRIYVIGLGNVSDGNHTGGSRVEVSVLKNSLQQAAK
jgi:outer membrane protein OmpA-like peptidoglycan-associated protein